MDTSGLVFRERLRRMFRRREIFYRGEERIHYVAISPALQAAAAALGVSLLMLAGSGILGTALYRGEASTQAEALAAARADYWKLLQSLDGLSERLDASETADAGAPGALVRDMLRHEMDKYSALFPRSDAQPGFLDALSRKLLPKAVPDGLLLAEAHSRLWQRARDAERNAARLAARERQLSSDLADGRQLLSTAEADRLEQSRSIDALSQRIGALETQLAAAEERNEQIGADLMVAQLELEDESERNQESEAELLSMAAKIAGLEEQIASYRSTQASWLLALGARTQDSIALVESAVAMTGVNVEKLVARAQSELRSAAGGPFIPEVPQSGALPEGMNAIATDVGVQVERWEALKRVMRAMPLSAPLDQYQIASSFGKRRDPINGRRAMHTGLDFNAPVKTPVLSTAPGRVVFAAWHREYGRLVEIDHGFGIRTRYAHLAEISVKKGEEVANRAKVGLLGSSGRSTGPHLHYEVLVDGKPMNPINFLEAARHVLKG
ncbi:MAG: peptidase [Rhodospirillales bacterium]|nr:peptidase [Rhodospirillales bacterium]